MVKYIFITGGVSSSLGKGIVSASLGALLESRGYKIRIKKMDPYLNVDPGTMSPVQHGEVFVTNDGAETDLDLGHYERFTSVVCNKNDSISAGKIYFNVLKKERDGDYLGNTIQVIPHVTDEIKNFISNDLKNEDFVICEIGGTVGDIEATPFLEAVRQFINDKGRENAMIIHLTLLPYLEVAGELKTKPTQHSVRDMQSLGLSPNILVCRSSQHISDNEKNKIALFCNVDKNNVIAGYDSASIYNVPLSYHNEGLDSQVINYFKISNKDIDLFKWKDLDAKLKNIKNSVCIAFIGKYISLKDAYKSLIEALNHAGIYHNLKVDIKWINSEDLELENIDLTKMFCGVDGILVAPGFGGRGVDGKINAVKYARINNIPFFGICYGMQMSVIEFCRNVLNIKNATSEEFDPENKDEHIVGLINEWDSEDGVQLRSSSSQKGGTMRLGSYDCNLVENSLIKSIYGIDKISERHRHRYEINIKYKNQLESHGMKISGISPDGKLPEIIELVNHRWFVGVQFHPELKSKIFNPHPLFLSFIDVCCKYKKERNNNE